MTDGILLRELEHDRQLRNYDTLIIDEAHERSLNIDFLLGVLKRVLPQRPELRVVITSATIDPQRFAEFFGGAPIIEVSGRSYPVEVRYRPLVGDDEDSELSLTEGIVAAVQELDREDRGDVLVFLPGEKQIREATEALGKARLHATEVLPLYSRLSTRDQELIFEKHGTRRIVLATNVAETSLTVPGMRHVVDSGLARISRYSVRGKVQRLPIEPISQASADQRKGRAGRESPGICIRLYAEDDFAARAPFTPPEVLRTNLASVILQMAALELGEPQDFPFVDPPDTRLINDGYKLLQELKAVDEARVVTSLGRQISTLPLDPRLARMLLAASHHRCVAEMLIIAAFLAAQDPRERPAEAQAQADQKHAAFADPRSDFLAVLNLWKAFAEQSAALSGSQLRKWCRENFLSFIRMREWQELQRQLGDIVAELQLRPNQLPADYNDLHQAILTGFLGNIGALDERREYEGARGTRFVIAPGTPLAAKPPKWVVAASLMETTRLYARMVAAVEPQWIEAAAEHLIKRSYSEPHWVEERGFVAAFESTSLYGLTLSSRRRVNYGSVAPREAQQIFVREALVEGHTRLRAPFLEHNRRLRREVEQLEAKLRRRDVLVDEQAMTDFYLQRLPPAGALDRCAGEVAARAASGRRVADVAGRSHAPRRAGGHCGEPSGQVAISQATSCRSSTCSSRAARATASRSRCRCRCSRPPTPADFATPIPGWRVEKITELLRALPKQVRKAFVPVPEHAARAAAEIDAEHKDFYAALADWITRSSGRPITAEELAALPVPDASALQHPRRRSERRGAGGRTRSARAEAQHPTGRKRAVGRPAGQRASTLGFRRGAGAAGRAATRAAIHRVSDAARSRRWRRADGGGERCGRRGVAAPGGAAPRDARVARAVQVRTQAVRRRPRHRAARPGPQHGEADGRIARRARVQRLFPRRGHGVAAHGGAVRGVARSSPQRASAKSSIACWRTHARRCASCATCARSLRALDNPAFQAVQQDARAQLQIAGAGGFPDRRAGGAMAALAALSQGARSPPRQGARQSEARCGADGARAPGDARARTAERATASATSSTPRSSACSG